MADKSKLVEINANNASLALSNVRHKELLAYQARTADTVLSATQSLIKFLEGQTTKTEVVNQLESIRTPDIEHVVKALNILDDTLKTHENTDLTGVTTLLNSILEEASKIPKELPVIPEQQVIDHTKQFENLTKAIQAVEKVVKAQKLIAEAPIVNVPETNVHVEAPDLKPLQDGFKDVVKAVTGIVIPEYKTDNKEVEKLLNATNKILQKILEKPVGGGGGGGSSWTAIGTNGFPAPLNLDASGNLKVTSTGGGGAGDASAANQTLQITEAQSTNTKLDTLNAKDFATQTTLALIKAKTDNLDVALSTRAVTGLTDTQLRATPVPVSGTVTTGGLTDTQLRATPVPISGSLTNISGTVSLPTGAATSAKQLPDNHNVVVTSAPTTPVTGTFFQATQPVSIAATVATKETQPSSSSVTSVANSATSVSILASNASRRMATFYNDDTLSTGAIVKLKLGATASSSSFTIAIQPGGYYELPQPVYTGAIDAIATAATGNLRITELS